MRQELHHKGCFNVWVPRGHEGYWSIMLRLDGRQGEFSVRDIDDESNVDAARIRHYVKLLVKGGFLKRVCHERRRGADVPIYRLIKKPKAAPRVRANGTVIFATAQEQLWTAIRNLKTFGLEELAFTATTDDVKVSHAFAKRYVSRLTRAGYLTIMQSQAGRHRKQVWRLKPGMNNGPKPPYPVSVTVLWDPNLEISVEGDAVAAEVAI